MHHYCSIPRERHLAKRNDTRFLMNTYCTELTYNMFPLNLLDGMENISLSSCVDELSF